MAPPVQTRILSRLCPKDFTALSQVSKDVHKVLEDGLRSSCFNINAKLLKFFQDPRAFRRVQAQTGALIGDDFARKFSANQLQDVPDDLHVYIQYVQHKLEKSLATLCEHLESDGWSTISNDMPPVVYQKKNRNDIHLNLHLHVGADSAIGLLLHSAPSTAALNFIAWNKAYALLPESTFIENVAYRLQGQICLWDYVDNLRRREFPRRGFRWGFVGGNEVTRTRRIGDERTWTITLDNSSLESVKSLTPDAVIESSTFEIEITHKPTRHTLGATWTFSHPILKHSYVTVIGDFYHQLTKLSEEMDRLTRLELRKVPEEKRPAEYADLMITRDEDQMSNMELDSDGDEEEEERIMLSTFKWDEGQVPETWTFFDDELVKHLRALWQLQTRVQVERDAKNNNQQKWK